MNSKSFNYEDYTYEDYTKDFEFDYLGFDGVPDEPAADISAEKAAGNEPDPESTEKPQPANHN